MNKKNKIVKSLVLITTFIMGITITGCTGANKGNEGNNENVLDTSKVTLITKVLPYGEVGYAMVCDYGDIVDASNLDPNNFKVETTIDGKAQSRTITKIYTNNEIALSESSKEGQYVVIELNPEDENASTMAFDEESFLSNRNQLDYTITQKSDIKTKTDKVFKATEEKIKSSNIITPIVDDFEKLTYKDESGNTMNYRLFEPKKEEGKKYPLVLFLHGSGERGDDNILHLTGNEGALVWADPEQQAKNPAYVLAPQALAEEELTMYWKDEPNYTTMFNLLKETIEKYDIDENRIYVIGMSNGGIGTWNIIEKNPDLFAAAVPICGIGDLNNLKLGDEYKPLEDNSSYKNIKDMPIWIFHAEDDPLVDVRYSRDALKAIEDLGGTSVKYTEYPEGTVMPMGHFSWVPALQDKEMIDWLFSQSK